MIRVYDHDGTLHIRGGQKQASIPTSMNQQELKRVLSELHKEGVIRYITLRTILEQ